MAVTGLSDVRTMRTRIKVNVAVLTDFESVADLTY